MEAPGEEGGLRELGSGDVTGSGLSVASDGTKTRKTDSFSIKETASIMFELDIKREIKINDLVQT